MQTIHKYGIACYQKHAEYHTVWKVCDAIIKNAGVVYEYTHCPGFILMAAEGERL